MGSSTDDTSPTRLSAPSPASAVGDPKVADTHAEPPPPPDALFSDPELVAAIIDMTTPSSSASAPPPSTDGSGLHSSSLSLSHLCTRSREEHLLYSCIYVQNMFPYPIYEHRARSWLNP